MESRGFGMDAKKKPEELHGKFVRFMHQNSSVVGKVSDVSTDQDLILNPHIVSRSNGDAVSIDEDYRISRQAVPSIEVVTEDMYEEITQPHPMLESFKDKPVRILSEGRPTYGILEHMNSQRIVLSKVVEHSARPTELPGPVHLKFEGATIHPISEAQYKDILKDHPFVALEGEYVRVISDGRPTIGHVQSVAGEKVTLDRVLEFGTTTKFVRTPRVFGISAVSMEGLTRERFKEFLCGHYLNEYAGEPVQIVSMQNQIVQYGVLDSATSEKIKLNEFLDSTQEFTPVKKPLYFDTNQFRVIPVSSETYEQLQQGPPAPTPESS